MWRGREMAVAMVCLVVGSVGQLVQYLVTPIGEGDSAAHNVAQAMAHPTAMHYAAWLDLCILFFLPAMVVVAYVAQARTSRLGWIGALLALGSAVIGIGYVLAPDVLYVGAIHGAVSVDAVKNYTDSSVVATATVLFLVGHVLGMILLAVALWRVGSVPRWAAIALAVSPLLEIAGAGSDVRAVGALAYVASMAAFGACGAVLLRSQPAPAHSAEPVPA